MESKFDWLTLSIKPESLSIDFAECMNMLRNVLLLGDLIDKMVFVGHFMFYDYVFSYENISLCYTEPERFNEQGVCLRISSQGLDYLTRYLKTYNITIKQWLGEFRALCFKGYVTKDTRLDYALDDIRFDGDKPSLTMKRVIDCVKRGEMCKRSRLVNLYDGDGLSVNERYKVVCKEPVVGRTVNVGSRQSEVFCRFYDKLAEQLQKKETVPESCTSWTRCELEFKHGAAMCVLNAFLDMNDEDFGKYMFGVVNRYISFIVRNNDNISRCPVKRWWSKFLGGCTEKFKLPHKAPARSALARAHRGLHKYVPTIYTLQQELGYEGLYRYFEIEADRMSENKSGGTASLYKKELVNNIREGVRDYEEMNGFKNYQYNSFDGEEGWSIEDNIKHQHRDYFDALFKALNLIKWERQRHDRFMDGYEVLY